MSNVDHCLDTAANIERGFAVALVDHESGMTLGSRSGSAVLALEVTTPGSNDVGRTKLAGLRESRRDLCVIEQEFSAERRAPTV